MGPQNGVVGDDFGTQLPETAPQEQSSEHKQEIARIKQMAKFTRSQEFAFLKNYIEGRCKLRQRYVPNADGSFVDITQLPNEERGWRSLAAFEVIDELTKIITEYEQAADYVKQNGV